jgi:hypothetical protein
MQTEDYLSRLGRWLKDPDTLEIEECVCSWTDLLGFSTTFTNASWSPSAQEWRQLIGRVARAYKTFCSCVTATDELILTLNDGIVRVKRPKQSALTDVALWLREVVLAHSRLNQIEFADGLPGARTIVTAGEKVRYSSIEEIKQDDLVLDYTRAGPGLSQFAEYHGNRTLVLNPELLQMNIAFSKAYLLDSFGSRQGISGAGLFLDESFFRYVQKLVQADSDRYSLFQETKDVSWLFAVAHANPTPDRPWLFGIRCESRTIPVTSEILETTVRRAKAFYPHDEDPAEFHFEL